MGRMSSSLNWVRFCSAGAGGKEVLNGVRYNYDFFNSIKFGGEPGLEYKHMLGENSADTTRFDVIGVPSGIAYPDGENRTLVGLSLTVGLRFFF